MDPSIEALLEQARTGQVSLEALRWRLVPEQERRILARAALVHAFDAQLLDKVLSLGLEPVPLEQLVASPFVERLPTLEGFYCLRERARLVQLQQWTGQQPVEDGVPRSIEEFRRLSSALAEYYARLGPEWQGERLYHLQAVAPDEAATLFEELFAEAERRFDIGRCHDLLNRLSERAAELPAHHELRRLIEDYRPRFEARALWSEEYYRSTRLQERPNLLNEVEELLGDTQRWILQIFATGGMGKSSFLWWVIARYFVPRGIACARIDFDDVQSGADEPWRLFLQLAYQLKLQVRGPDLEKLEYELRRIESASSGPSSSPVDAGYSHEVSDRFAYALLESGHRTPVVLIFDTLEEALLHRGTALVTLLDHLASIRKVFPPLKVVLSGRYDLRERIEELEAKFGPELRSLRIQPFTEQEAREYLTGRRGFSHDDTRAEAVMRKAAGVPFKLSLLADHVQRTGATAEEISAYPAADMLYLIKRVVERIEDPQVRWLLRYGVIPRKLTLSFVEEVMARHLPPAMAGTSTLDDPDADELPTQPFRTDLLGSPQEPVAVRELWKKLTRYATESDYGWVRRVVGPQDALVFHENVVNPMRRLLQEHEVFHQLHKEAAELYESKAGSPSNPRWIDGILEAIYHRFQLQGADAEAFWRRQLELARAERKVGWRLSLAKEILGSEYLDPDNRPRLRWDDTPMVSPAALLEANLELAEANLELLSTQGDRRRSLHEAQAAVDWANSIRKESDPQVVVGTRLVAAEARIALEAGRAPHALSLVQAVSMEEQHPEEQLTLRMIEADALRAQDRNPLPALLAAQKLIDSTPAAGRTRRQVWLSAGLSAWDQHADAIRVAEAAERISEAVDPAGDGTLSEDAQRCRSRRVEAHLLAGQPSAAAQLLSELQTPSIEGQLLEARVSLARGDPDTALERLQATMSESHLLGPSDFGLKEQALTQQLIALARARQLRFKDATVGFEEALDLWRKADGTEGYDRCLRAYVAFLLHDVGDNHAARQILDRRKSGRTRSMGPEAVRLTLLEAELWAAEGQPSRTLDALSVLSQVRELSAGLRARIELARIILGGEAARHIELLEEHLSEVQTVSARLGILRALRRVTEFPRDAAARILRLVPLDGTLHREDQDRAILLRAELHRFTGDPRVRDELGGVELPNLGLEFRREMTLLQDRLGWPPGERAPVWRNLPEFHPEGPPQRLVGALLLEEVERRLRFGSATDFGSSTPALSTLLRVAEHHLDVEERVSLWDLRLAAAWAAVAGEEESFKTAESIRARLGAPRTQPTPSDTRREIHVRLRVAEQGGLAVETQWPGERPRSSRVDRGIAEMLSRGPTAVPYAAVRPFASDWRELARDLGQLLLQDTAPMLSAIERPMDFRLRTSPLLHAMPWELALFSSQEPILGLLPSIHGISRDLDRGPQPSEEASGQAAARPDTHTIALVVPSYGGERGRVSGYKRHFSGILRPLYSLKQDVLLHHLSRGNLPLRLLHFCVEMTESSHGGPALRFARELQQQSNAMLADSEELTPSLLGSALSGLPSRGIRPLVVLEIARPRGITELLRQVFLRNVFAAELFGLGVCSAVLCTGLAEFELGEEMTEVLVSNLMRGESLATTSQRVRQVALKVIGSRRVEQVSLEEILGPASTALFAADSHFRPFPREPEES